jgi:hypothetical protein
MGAKNGRDRQRMVYRHIENGRPPFAAARYNKVAFGPRSNEQ